MTFDRFLQEVCPSLDLQWRKYRRRSAKHRIDDRMRELEIEDYRAYLELIRSDPREAGGRADLMRITVSRFSREREAWRELKDTVLSSLIAAKSSGGTVHAWSAGCCGGEEPYTLALIWIEDIQQFYPERPLDILANDIDDASLERALQGRYIRSSLREAPGEILSRRFFRNRGYWCLSKEIKGLIRFEKRNIMANPLPSGMELVLCRYLAFTY